jgi:hypothetical protein
VDATDVINHPDEFSELIEAAVTDPWEDVLAPSSYRKRVAAVAAKRALSEMQRSMA